MIFANNVQRRKYIESIFPDYEPFYEPPLENDYRNGGVAVFIKSEYDPVVFKSNIQQQQIHNKSQLCKPVSAFGYILILPLQYIFIVFIQGSPTKQNSIMIVDPVWHWSL